MEFEMLPKEKTWSGPRWLSLDLHVHSTYSGGSLNPREILNWCSRSLLDGVAISDHNEVQGAIEGQEAARMSPHFPEMVASQEVSAGEHLHFLLIGSKKAQHDVKRREIVKVVQRHRDEGGAVILAHPWTMPEKSWAVNCLKEMAEADLIDGMELCNASLLELTTNPGRILTQIWEEWVLPFKMGVVGGSDYHYLHKSRLMGSGRTYVKVNEPGEKGIIDALRSRRSVGGLFNYRFTDWGWADGGYSLLLGMDPWLTEVRTMALRIKEKIENNTCYTPQIKSFLNNLVEAGNFQMAYDLLEL